MEKKEIEKNVKANNVTAKNINEKRKLKKNQEVINVTAKNVNGKKRNQEKSKW